MKKISKQKFILIFSIIAFILSCAIFYFALRSISSKNNQASDAHARYLEKVALQEKISSLKDQVNETETDRDTIDTYFLGGEKTVSFLTYLESLLASAGVTGEISSVSKNDTTDQGGGPLLYVSLEAEGDFASMYSYINFVENIPYEYSIERASLVVRKSTDPLVEDKWILSMSMIIESITI